MQPASSTSPLEPASPGSPRRVVPPNLDAAGSGFVGAWFLDPKTENAEDRVHLVIEALRDQAFWRRNYFPGAPPTSPKR